MTDTAAAHDETPTPGWSSAPKCGHPTRAGAPCPRPVMPGTKTCFTHGLPEGQRRPPQRGANGGDAAVQRELADALEGATTPGEVREVLTQTGAAMLRGEIQQSVARTLLSLASVILRSITEDLTAEMAELKALLATHASADVQGWAKRKRGDRA